MRLTGCAVNTDAGIVYAGAVTSGYTTTLVDVFVIDIVITMPTVIESVIPVVVMVFRLNVSGDGIIHSLNGMGFDHERHMRGIDGTALFDLIARSHLEPTLFTNVPSIFERVKVLCWIPFDVIAPTCQTVNGNGFSVHKSP